MEKKLYNLGIPLSDKEFFLALSGVTVFLAVVVYVLWPTYTPFVLALPMGVLFFLEYLHGRKLSATREELPRFVHFLSTHPTHTLREVIRVGSDGFGELSKEFRGVLSIVETGVSPVRALRGWARRLGDPEVSRMVEGLLSAFRGGDVGEYLKNLSEEMYFTQELENERRGAMALQRYSIAFSSAILVPFILGVVVSMVVDLSGDIPATSSLIPPYLVLLSLISGSFLAMTEGKPKNAPFYILVTVTVALATYWVVLWLY